MRRQKKNIDVLVHSASRLTAMWRCNARGGKSTPSPWPWDVSCSIKETSIARKTGHKWGGGSGNWSCSTRNFDLNFFETVKILCSSPERWMRPMWCISRSGHLEPKDMVVRWLPKVQSQPSHHRPPRAYVHIDNCCCWETCRSTDVACRHFHKRYRHIAKNTAVLLVARKVSHPLLPWPGELGSCTARQTYNIDEKETRSIAQESIVSAAIPPTTNMQKHAMPFVGLLRPGGTLHM